jgi:hypothetical protein
VVFCRNRIHTPQPFDITQDGLSDLPIHDRVPPVKFAGVYLEQIQTSLAASARPLIIHSARCIGDYNGRQTLVMCKGGGCKKPSTLAGLRLFSTCHHLVGESFGSFDQQVLPIFMSGLSYDRCRQIAFGNQRSAEILIPDSLLRRLFAYLVGDHMGAPFDEVAPPFYASIANNPRASG